MEEEKKLKFGNIKMMKKRGSQNPKYYEPLYNTPDCTYSGKKRGRKSISEKIEQYEKEKLKKINKEIIISFD